jgi:membrane carboxypeptidase/penicillin-binding protein
VMYVKEKLVALYGDKMVEQGGLKVTTTLDLPLQEYAEITVASEVAKLTKMRVGNGATLITKPATGEILAMVGSKDYYATDSGSFNATTAMRQPGSAIKPINYAIGIENKIVTPATVFNDVPTCFNAIPIGYCPRNYDGNWHGPVQLRFALGNSYNIPAVKMLKLNTVETMIASSSGFGITTFTDPSRYGLSLTLGGGEVPMTEMATAFGIFANGGIRKDLTSILKVEDKDGKILEENKDPNITLSPPSQLLLIGPRIVSSETAFLISHILLDQNARSAAFGSSLLQITGHPAVSVKTGTTDDKRDNWTIGFTPEILVAAWVGNNDNKPMDPYLTSGITGAAPIWNKIISYTLKDIKESWPKQPEGIIGMQVCPISGLLPPDGEDCHPRYEYFIKGTQPTEKEHLKQSVSIDNVTQKLAGPNQTENVSTADRLIVKDPLNSLYCIDCPHDNDPVQVIK